MNENHFTKELVNELNDWTEKHPHVIQPQNVSDSLSVKTIGVIIKKQKHLLQISAQELHNDLILQTYQGGFFGARNVDGKICIGDTPLRKYIPIHIKQMSNTNKIICRRKTCISTMALQSYLNIWWLSQLFKLDKLYINSASTTLLQRSNIYIIE